MDEKHKSVTAAGIHTSFLKGFRKIGLSVGVFFTLISSAFLFMVGVYHGVFTMIGFLDSWIVKDALSGLIKTMDIFLAALVMMLLALGLYDLFLADAEKVDDKVCGHWPGFSATLDELKNSLAKLIIIILTITFLELVLANMETLIGYELLIVPVGACLVAVSLRLVIQPVEKKN